MTLNNALAGFPTDSGHAGFLIIPIVRSGDGMYDRFFTKSWNQVYSTSMQNAAYIGMDLIPLPKPKFLLEILYAIGLLYSWTKVFMLMALTLVPFLTST